VPPIAVVFIVTGLAVWLNALYFLGVGAAKQEGSPDPAVTVGAVTFLAGLVGIVSAIYAVYLGEQGEGAPTLVLLGGLIGFYGAFFTGLGWSLSQGLDLRPIANLAVAVAVVPLFWWNLAPFQDHWMFRSILVLWAVAFLSVTATVYGKLPGRVLGSVLLVTATYGFFLPIVIAALSNDAIPFSAIP
jgi:hypothetical protein